MAESAPSYGQLERKLDMAASYILGTSDAELRKVSPKLIKAKHVILGGKRGLAQYRMGEESINTLDEIMVMDKLYGEKAATEIAAEAGYEFRPLLNIMKRDAAKLGLEEGGLKLHQIYEKVVENEGTELHRLIAEMASYSEIVDAEKTAIIDCEVNKGAARKIHDFEANARSMKLKNCQNVLTGGLAAHYASSGKKVDEKKIKDEAAAKFPDEFGKWYSPEVCNAIFNEYLPNATISKTELIAARGTSKNCVGAMIIEPSRNARQLGKAEYAFSPSYCERVAAIRASVLEKEGYDCVTGENGDVLAFHKSASGQKNMKEQVLIHQKDTLFGTSVKYLEDAVKAGEIVQIPKLGNDGGIEHWDLQDYKVYVSDLLKKEVAMPVLLHELKHVGNRLEAFESMMNFGGSKSYG